MKNLKDLTDEELNDLETLNQNEIERLNREEENKRLSAMRKEFIEGKDIKTVYSLQEDIKQEKEHRPSITQKKSRVYGDPLVEFD